MQGSAARVKGCLCLGGSPALLTLQGHTCGTNGEGASGDRRTLRNPRAPSQGLTRFHQDSYRVLDPGSRGKLRPPLPSLTDTLRAPFSCVQLPLRQSIAPSRSLRLFHPVF